MIKIYEVRDIFLEVAKEIDNYTYGNNLQGKFKSELLQLSGQCTLSADKIIRDHADEGLALENCQIILRQFNELVLEYENVTY